MDAQPQTAEPHQDALIEHIIIRTMTMMDRIVLRENCIERHQMQNIILEKLERRIWQMVVTSLFQALAAVGVLIVLIIQIIK